MKRILKRIKPLRKQSVIDRTMGKKDEHNFKTPEGYFDSFHDRLIQKMNQDGEKEELSFLPKSDGFVTPKNYFETLEPQILLKVGKKETKVITLKSYRRYFYGAAAIAAVFLVFFGLNLRSDDSVAFEDLASTEIDAYLEYNEIDLSSYELAELVSIEESELTDVVETPLESENILEYLDENIEDIDELNLNFEEYE